MYVCILYVVDIMMIIPTRFNCRFIFRAISTRRIFIYNAKFMNSSHRVLHKFVLKKDFSIFNHLKSQIGE